MAEVTTQTANGDGNVQIAGDNAYVEQHQHGFGPEAIAVLMREERAEYRAEREDTEKRRDELAKQMDVSRGALLGFFKILKEDEVPLEQLATKLALVAQRHNDLLARLGALDPEDDEARGLIERAREVIRNAASSADYDRADDLLFQAEEAQDKTLAGAEALEREAHEAARRLRLTKASTRAERAELSLTRLDYLKAAEHFRVAAEFVGESDPSLRFYYLMVRSVRALLFHGSEKRDIVVLARVIEVYRELLGLYTRDHFPLYWADNQNNLGAALSMLGDLESDTKRLEEAVAAYRAALQEYTRERVPLQWAMTQNNLGTVLVALAGRQGGETARTEEGVAAYRSALEEYTRDRVPLDWAMTHTNLGNALCALGELGNATKQLEEAVAAHHAALEVYARGRVPLLWAPVQSNLGKALQAIGDREEGTERLEAAADAIEAALSVFQEADMRQYDGYFELRLAKINELVERRRGGDKGNG